MTTQLKPTGMAACLNFFMAFPPPQHNSDPSRIVSTQAFDQWAERCGYYSLKSEPATINAARNDLRNKINNTAISAKWEQSGKVPFVIQVTGSGYMKVDLSLPAFDEMSERLGTKTQTTINTKYNRVAKVLSRLDMTNADPTDQVRVDSVWTAITDANKTIAFVIHMCNANVMRNINALSPTYRDLMHKAAGKSGTKADASFDTASDDSEET